jgi:hypothetical protein
MAEQKPAVEAAAQDMRPAKGKKRSAKPPVEPMPQPAMAADVRAGDEATIDIERHDAAPAAHDAAIESVAVDGAPATDDASAAGVAGTDGAPAADNALAAGDGAAAAEVTPTADGVTPKRRTVRAAGERDPRLPPAGTVLEREYKGKVYRVTLLQDNGCLYEGRQYGSLSGLAKEITGTSHNGLVWFALVKRPALAKMTNTPADGAPSES